MTQTLRDPLPRPEPAEHPGRLDDTFYDLVETRLRRLVRDNPVFGTALGLHDRDDELGDGSREAVLAELDADRAHLGEIEALDADALSPQVHFERDLELHNVRRGILDTETIRIWERRSFALDTIGDGLFLLFARDHAPLGERLEAIAGRLEAIPAYLEESKSRATVPQVRLWQGIEIETASEMPVFFDEIVAAADGTVTDAERRRLERAAASANVAIDLYTSWLEGTLPDGTDDWPVGREHHDAMVAHRAFDGLDADAILELGWQKLSRGEGSADRCRARSRCDRDRGAGRGPRQVHAAADLRCRTRRLSRRDAAGQGAPHRARPRHRPERRADRRHRDPRVPAQRHPVRRVLLARQLRRGSQGHLCRDAVRGPRPERDARAQPRLDQQHEHP